MAVQVSRRLFTVDEYHQMAQAGILTEDDRVELLEGEIIQMAAIGSRHAACVDRLNHLFSRYVAGRAIVRVQSPIHLSEISEPQPDLALLRLRPDFYAAAHPGPQDILLVIEVADTSVGYDQEAKLPRYAQTSIAEAWIVNIPEDRLEVYRQPTFEGYQEVVHLGRGEHLTPVAFPDLSLAVDTILGTHPA
jgi:Uma2 family endonuclease